ncbi:unnamed protein product [Urochloa humidicola]
MVAVDAAANGTEHHRVPSLVVSERVVLQLGELPALVGDKVPNDSGGVERVPADLQERDVGRRRTRPWRWAVKVEPAAAELGWAEFPTFFAKENCVPGV